VQWKVSTNGGSTFAALSNGTDGNGAVISGATTTTLSVADAPFAENSYEYEAVFTNTDGNATSSAATLTVDTVPVITTAPTNQTVIAGGNATFTAAASGNPTPTAQWKVSTNDGSTFSNISGATSTTLNLTDVPFAENGYEYEVVFTNAAGNVTAGPATLTVETVPVVTTPPVDETESEGETATFTAAASGSPTPTVQWVVSTNGGSTFADVTGATSTTLNVTDVTSADNGYEYEAVFTNVAGSATSEAATLTYTAITGSVAGSASSYNLTSLESADGVTDWAHWGDSISGDSADGSLIGISNGFTHDLTGDGQISNVTQLSTNDTGNNPSLTGGRYGLDDSGTPLTWTDGDENDSAQSSDSADLYQNSQDGDGWSFTVPADTTQRTLYILAGGDGYTDTTLSARLSDDSSPEYVFPVQSPDGGTYRNLYAISYSASEAGQKLTVNFEKTSDSGDSGNGSANLEAAWLVGPAVTAAAPTVTLSPVTPSGDPGQAVTLTATASGDPLPSVQWQVSTDGGETFSNISGATTTSYSFVPDGSQDGNEYQAVFTNSGGSATTTPVTYTPAAVAPVITTQPAEQDVVSGGTVTFTAAASGSPDPTVQWQVSTDDGSTWANISGATSTSYSFTDDGGEAGNLYQAVFTNTAGSATTVAAGFSDAPSAYTATTMTQLQNDIADANPGDTIYVTNGTYDGSLNLSGKNDITIEAYDLVSVTVNASHSYGGGITGPYADGGGVIIDATGDTSAVSEGTNITLDGITVDGCSNTLQNAAVDAGAGWTMNNCIVEYCAAGGINISDDNVTLANTYAQLNGASGIGSGNGSNTSITNLNVTDCGTFHNNRGSSSSTPFYLGDGEYYGVEIAGVYYCQTSYTGGGGKFTYLDGATFNNYWADGNNGPGMWFDVADSDVNVTNLQATNNVDTDGNSEGQGFEVEISGGPITFDHCLLEGNADGSSIAESTNVVVTDCDITDGFFFRNLSGREYIDQDDTVTGNRFYGSADIGLWGNMDDTYNSVNNIVISPNTTGLSLSTLDWEPI
jgi:hypothetical protein